MVTENSISCQERLESFLQTVGEAQQLQRDWLNYGLDCVYLYVQDVESDWLEKWGEIEEEKISAIAINDPVNLGHWLQGIFEPDWQPAETLINTEKADFFGFTPTDIKRAKRIALDEKLNSAIALVVAIRPKDDGKISLLVQLHPLKSEPFLSEGISLSLLSPAGQLLSEVTSDIADQVIQQEWVGQSGEGFNVQIQTAEMTFTAAFVI